MIAIRRRTTNRKNEGGIAIYLGSCTRYHHERRRRVRHKVQSAAAGTQDNLMTANPQTAAVPVQSPQDTGLCSCQRRQTIRVVRSPCAVRKTRERGRYDITIPLKKRRNKRQSRGNLYMHGYCHQRIAVKRTNHRNLMSSARRKTFKPDLVDHMTIYLLNFQRCNPERTYSIGNIKIAAASTQLKVRTAGVKGKPPYEHIPVVRKKRQYKRTFRRPQAARPFQLIRRKSGIPHRMRRNKRQRMGNLYVQGHRHQTLVVHRTNHRKLMTSILRKTVHPHNVNEMTVFLLIPETSSTESGISLVTKV